MPRTPAFLPGVEDLREVGEPLFERVDHVHPGGEWGLGWLGLGGSGCEEGGIGRVGGG